MQRVSLLVVLDHGRLAVLGRGFGSQCFVALGIERMACRIEAGQAPLALQGVQELLLDQLDAAVQGGEVLTLAGRRDGPLEVIQHRGKIEEQTGIRELDRLLLVAVDAFAEVLEVGLLAQQLVLQRGEPILELVELLRLRGIGIGSAASGFAGSFEARALAGCGGIQFAGGLRRRVRFRSRVRARSGRTVVAMARGVGAGIRLGPRRAARTLRWCGTAGGLRSRALGFVTTFAPGRATTPRTTGAETILRHLRSALRR